MTDNLGDVIKELRNCVNLACDHKGPLKAASRIIEMLEKDLKPSINRYSEAEKGNEDKVVDEIEKALDAAKNAASAIRSYLKAEMEFRNINKGGTSENQVSTHGALGDYKAAGRNHDSIRTHIEALIIQGQPTHASDPEAELQLFEVGTYGDLKSRPRNGMEIDHIPSKAALCEAACRYIEILTENPITDEEKQMIKKVVERHGGAIAVPKSMHRKNSRTIGGRNTAKQVVEDSLNIVDAVTKDLEYYDIDSSHISVLKTKLVNQLSVFPEEIWKLS